MLSYFFRQGLRPCQGSQNSGLADRPNAQVVLIPSNKNMQKQYFFVIFHFNLLMFISPYTTVFEMFKFSCLGIYAHFQQSTVLKILFLNVSALVFWILRFLSASIFSFYSIYYEKPIWHHMSIMCLSAISVGVWEENLARS